MSRLLIFFILLTTCTVHVQCKICPSLRIINNIEKLRKLTNCTEITGNLMIMLLDKVKHESDFNGYVFPDLLAISGYLLILRISYLTSIGQLFPNLHLIRGQTLVKNYALIIYDMPDLLQIGTTNLISFERGGIIIQRCPKLCFANTVNWKLLGAEPFFTDKTWQDQENCDSCPSRCKGSCWNSTDCVVVERGCHKECLGCTKRNSPKHCVLCRHMKKNGECVQKCPDNKYELKLLHECISKEDCENFTEMVTGNSTPYFLREMDKQCANECPAYYHLNEIIINEKKVIRTCDYCGDNCTKECIVTETIESEQELTKLTGCTHITGPLIIKNLKVSEPNKLLNTHLSTLRFINGTLKILRTKLTSLDFLRNVTYIGMNDTELTRSNYSIVIYENPYLEKLWDFNNDLHLKGHYSFHDNPLLCLSEIKKLYHTTKVNYSSIDVSEYSNGDQATCITVNLTNTINVNVTSTNATLIWESPKLEKDEYYLSYTVYYKEDNERIATFSNSTICELSDWSEKYVTNSSAFLDNLLPFSTYAYYIKSYTSRRQGSLSYMMHFNTLTDDPDGFSYFKLTAIDYQTIKLEWAKPKSPNGILAMYNLFYIELAEDYLFERNYCKYPRRSDGDYIDYDEDNDYNHLFHPEYTNKAVVTKSENTCNCSETKSDIEEEFEIITKGDKSQLCYDLAKSLNDKRECLNYQYQAEKREKREKEDYRNKGIGPNETSFIVDHLKPYTNYVFYLSACNLPETEHHCSGVLQRFIRTQAKPNADKIEDLRIELLSNSSVNISWMPPKTPNSPILAYRINISSEISESNNICIPMYEIYRQRIFKTVNDIVPGKHIVSVQAESLAGISDAVYFPLEVPSLNSSNHTSLIVVGIFGIIFIGACIAGYVIFKKRTKDRAQLITDINPDYEGTVYVADHWEMDANDIERIKELGRGNFGTVYQGRIKSKNLQCAVKVSNESLSLHQKMEFFIEASLMKSFNDCYHVIKLLGVVSVCKPPLVVMELMERGDLKKYLRKIRDSSHNLTSGEIYRMAVEIADGMAYLSAKKFVHRDLAARNCLVAGDRTIKIGDFGMARDIYTNEYYKKESKGLLPVRWMAPESLADGIFTTDSDVWSYGIVLWEIATLAEQPYQGLSNEQVRQFIISKGRMSRPPECSDLLYEVMKQCWSWRPNDRPTFWDIVERLEDKVSEDFKLVSFVHSPEASLCSRQRVDHPAALCIARRDELLCHYNVSEEDVSLQVGGVPRRPSYLQASMTHRRFSPPDDIY